MDTKLERTLRNLRKVKSDESTIMVDQRERMQPIPEEAELERPKRQMTIEDFWSPIIQDEYFVVRQPAIEANNFELSQLLSQWCNNTNLLGILVKNPTSIWEDF